ncbi:MAG TPA: transglycosylase domain-containing protein, partial [Spirochaetota bacterium]|nr:transglycosylase domain-containing protein [Spirochaetota bacterium]
GIPLICCFLIILYTSVVYIEWLHDKQNALDKLFKYKQLIDRTEELKGGYSYTYSEIDVSAKVVDIPTRIYDRNNEIIGEFFEQKREIVPYSYFPKWLIKAVIASEDRNFYNHKGVNYKGIARAFITNIIHFRVVQGGSTITQQLAKVLFTDMERSIKRKIYEIFCAFEIEKHYDKQDILSMYLNYIYFGNGAYGVEAASKMFFGKSIVDCNETECAMIVATISNPLIYSPLNNLDLSLKKTKRIMQSMIDAGFISSDQAQLQYRNFIKQWEVKFSKDTIAESSLIGSFIFSLYRINRAPFFNEYIRRILVNKFSDEVVKKGGLTVYTTIDAKKQDIAITALRKGIQLQREYHEKIAKALKNPDRALLEMEKANNIEGAFVSLNPFTGEIISYAGGYNFSYQNQLDHVQQIRRQPGSSFKPIIYVAAIQDKVITPSSVFDDIPMTFKGGYAPKNYDGFYSGKIIIREALKKSVNIVAVQVLEKEGYSRVMSIIQKGLNLTNSELDSRFYKTLSLALGTYELSPLENAVLHSVIVNGGDFVVPYGIRYVNDYNGNIVWNNEEEVLLQIQEKRKEFGKIIDPSACAIVVSMLKGVFEEGGTASWILKNRSTPVEIAGKTGTSSDFVDAWFIGYTPDSVSAVWIGNKAGAISLGRGRSGGVLSAPVWADYIFAAYKDAEYKSFSIPADDITKQTICLDTGLVPRGEGWCPRIAKDELFYAGTEPGEYCTMHTVPVLK